MEATLTEWVITLLASNPHLAILITVMSVCRMIFKPACALVQQIVDATPGKSDDVWWLRVQENKVFKAAAWLMDYLISLKFPVKK
jgi:hypothetical protein